MRSEESLPVKPSTIKPVLDKSEFHVRLLAGGVSQNHVVLGGAYNKNHNCILGSILGSRCLGKLQFLVRADALAPW